MKTKSINLQLILFTLAAVILNTIIFYIVNCSGSVLQSKDIFGTKYSYTMEEIILQKNLLKGLPADLNEAEALLTKQLQDLDADFADNPLYNTSEETFVALQAAQKPYKAVLARIMYIKNYTSYVTGIADNATALLQLPLYNREGWIRNNIIKTQKDFYGLELVTLTPVVEAGYMSLLNYRITDIFALLLTLGTIWVLAPSKELSAKKHFVPPVTIWLTGICVMYLINTGLEASYIGLPDFHITLQSLPPFQSCPYLISCGALLAVCLAFKLAGFAVLFCVGLLLLSCRRKLSVILFAGAMVLELILALQSGAGGISVLFREINLFSAFSVERFFLRYLNLDILGQAVSSFPLFAAFMILFTAGMLFTASRQVSSYSREILAQAERDYYDELDRRHEESRKIRHDINNHLLALNLLIEKGDLTGARSYIGEISEQIDQTIMPVRTGSNVLDALIWQKLRQARKLSVELKTEVHCSLSGRGISDYDLCGIFGNILDNAMEAVKGAEEPVISLFISNQMNMLYISCENTYEGELKRRGDKFITTKGDTEHHGFGIARVKEIAKLYHGEVNISTENGRFLIEILLNNK